MFGEGHEGVLQAGAGHLQILEGNAATDQVTSGRVGVERMRVTPGAADLYIGHPLQAVVAIRIGIRSDESHMAGRHGCLERGPRAVRHDPAMVDHDHPVGDWSASSRWWVANTMVRPSSPNWRIIRQNVLRPSTSMATVGSSRKTSSGSPAMASANRTRWASPPESALVRRAEERPDARPLDGRLE